MMYCCRPKYQSASAVATATSALVSSWTRMKLSICALMSSRISTVSFFCQRCGPAILTIFFL